MLLVEQIEKIKEALQTPGDNRQEAMALCNQLLDTIPTCDKKSKESFEKALQWTLHQLGFEGVQRLEEPAAEIPLGDLIRMSLSSLNDVLSALVPAFNVSEEDVKRTQDNVRAWLQERLDHVEAKDIAPMLGLTAWVAMSALQAGEKDARIEEEPKNGKKKSNLKVVH